MTFPTPKRPMANDTAPGIVHYAVTPADNAALPHGVARKLYVLTPGNLVVEDCNGTKVTYPVTAGQVLEFAAWGVDATNTTATCVAWY